MNDIKSHYYIIDFLRSFYQMVNNKIKPSEKTKCIKDKTEPPKIEYDFHKQSLTSLSQYFNTSLTDGLSDAEAKQLLIKNGKNLLAHHKKNLIWKLIGYLFSGFCGLLWIAAIVFLLAWKPIGNPPDTTNLGMSVLLVVVILLQVSI